MMLTFLLVLVSLLMVCPHVSIPILGPSDIYVIAYTYGSYFQPPSTFLSPWYWYLTQF
jgi:hypothetical protein